MRICDLRRSVGASAIAAAFLTLTGCATYQAEPLSPSAFPAQFAARRLEARAGGWTQADLLSVALDNSPTVREARAKYATALAARKVARQAPAGTLTLTTEYSKDAGGDGPWLYGFTSDFPLDMGGRRDSRLQTADLTALQALYDYGEAVWAVRVALARALAEVRGGEEEVAMAMLAQTLRQDRFDRLTRRVEAGEDARPAALLAQGDLFAAQRRVNDAKARRAQARLALAAALGLPVAALDSLTFADAPTAPKADLNAWREEALLSRRDILRAVADYDLAEAALRLEVARQYPQVSIGPGYTWERGVHKIPFSLGLTLPPYDLNRAAIAQAEARRAEAGRSLEAAQASVLASFDKAVVAMTAAHQAESQVEERDQPLTGDTLKAMQRLQTAGEGDRVDELAAEAAVVDAELAGVDAHRTAALAAIDIEDAVRRAFDPHENDLLKAAMAAGESR